MGTIKITSDSTCDLSEELIGKYEIDTVPLYINLGEESYKDMVEIKPSDIFSYADKTGTLPKTSAVTIGDYIELFSKYTNSHDAIIHINLGQGFSSCYQNATIAAKDFENVYVVNSANLSSGTGHLVIEAAIMAQEGIPAKEIVERLEELANRVEASFVIDTLDYLRMGGRCSSVAALSANLLNIKPSIEVMNGAMEVGKKYRGRFEKAIPKYIADRLNERNDIIPDRIFITHTGCSEELVDKTKELVKEHYAFSEIHETTASCTISSHCGPGTLGILFIRK
ncbi:MULTISPECIES: DegV family protein [Bacillaceae]|uniref:DegV family protein n=1 Tax=Evansella alkalicola TaxID=745819 RepID=A0ABS6JWN4_9BACI|nr:MULTISPECIES: DegV family protein [Bacillaceae]MBU9722974.1 DegV family protein [Bacillus alkalicola]